MHLAKVSPSSPLQAYYRGPSDHIEYSDINNTFSHSDTKMVEIYIFWDGSLIVKASGSEGF